MVSDELAIGPECVTDSSNQVWSAMFRYVFCRQNVVRYSVVCLPVHLLVILLALLIGVWYWGEVGGGRAFCVWCMFAEVRDRCISQVHPDDGPPSSLCVVY